MSVYRRWRGHSEIVFEEYRNNKKMLKHHVEALSYSRNHSGGGKGSGISDPTARAAVSLLSDARYQEIKRQVQAVEAVMRRLPENRRALLERAYIERRCNLAGAAAYFGISEKTAQRWKKLACIALARELGWID